MWGIVEKLLSNIDEIYYMEKQSLVGEGVADVPESKKKIVYDSLISFKDSLKIICEIMIDDVFSHEETFKPRSMVSSTGATYDGASTMPASVPYTIRSTNCTTEQLGFIGESEGTPTLTRSEEMLSECGEENNHNGSNCEDKGGSVSDRCGSMSEPVHDYSHNYKSDRGSISNYGNNMTTILSESREHSQEIYDLSNDFKSRSTDLIKQKLAEGSKVNKIYNISNSKKMMKTLKSYSAIYVKSIKNLDKNKRINSILKLDEKTIQKLDEKTIQKLDEKTIQKLDEKTIQNEKAKNLSKINTSKLNKKNKEYFDESIKLNSPYGIKNMSNNHSFSNIELLRKYGKLQTAIRGKHSKPKYFFD